MTDNAECKFAFAQFQSLVQRFERGVRGCTSARNRRVTAVLSVAWIIDQEKRVVLRPIFVEGRRPIERERTVTAKRDPKTFRRWRGRGDVIGTIFRGRDRVVNFDAV